VSHSDLQRIARELASSLQRILDATPADARKVALLREELADLTSFAESIKDALGDDHGGH
jgi:hypothetical protein